MNWLVYNEQVPLVRGIEVKDSGGLLPNIIGLAILNKPRTL